MSALMSIEISPIRGRARSARAIKAIAVVGGIAISLLITMMFPNTVGAWICEVAGMLHANNVACRAVVATHSEFIMPDAEFGVNFKSLSCRFIVFDSSTPTISDELFVARTSRPSQWDRIATQYAVGTSHTVYSVRQARRIHVHRKDLILAGLLALAKIVGTTGGCAFFFYLLLLRRYAPASIRQAAPPSSGSDGPS